MNRGREKIRQAYLVEEKARREAEAAALKAVEEEVSTSLAHPWHFRWPISIIYTATPV